MSDDPMDWYISSATNMYFFERDGLPTCIMLFN